MSKNIKASISSLLREIKSKNSDLNSEKLSLIVKNGSKLLVDNRYKTSSAELALTQLEDQLSEISFHILDEDYFDCYQLIYLIRKIVKCKFRSMSEASILLNKSKTYISDVVNDLFDTYGNDQFLNAKLLLISLIEINNSRDSNSNDNHYLTDKDDINLIFYFLNEKN